MGSSTSSLFLAGRIKDEEDVFHVLDTAKRYGEIAEEKFQSWASPAATWCLATPRNLKGLMDKELDEVEVAPEEEPKPRNVGMSTSSPAAVSVCWWAISTT